MGKRKETGFATKAVRGGQRPDPTTGAIVTPIYQTATYVLEELGKDRGYDYSRTTNPTRETLERNIAELEGGRFGVAFASGMAAISATLHLLKQGDHVVVSEDVYGGTYRLFQHVLRKYGLSFTFVDTTDLPSIERALKNNTRMMWIESPSNPLLKITDIEAVSELAKEFSVMLVADTTMFTPYFLRPLELGVDVVIHSTTKYLSGHNQVIGGAAVTDDEK
ncbi:MAG: trans-sulfuration enzyme family protein, partial [Candidatus Geothermarchaeales archaeon]